MQRTHETKTCEQDMIYEKLRRSRFKQQRLPALRPVPTITSNIIIFSSVGVFSIALGVVLLIYSNNVIEFILRYDEECGTKSPCFLNIKLNKTMKAPVMIHYQINNFYQNHRKLLSSYSKEQLKGANLSYEQLNKSAECDHRISNQDFDLLWSYNGFELDPEAVAIPCGLMAKSFFIDKFSLYDENETIIPIDEKNISYPEDKKIFKNIEGSLADIPDFELKIKSKSNSQSESEPEPEYWQFFQWVDMTDEHFIVWMRPAAYPNFRKLWGRIRQDIEPGDYLLEINNTFEVSRFNGEKYFIISTVNFFGSQNTVLSYSYIAIGCISIILAISFFAWSYVNKTIKLN